MALLKKQQHTDQEEPRFPLGRAARLMTLSALAAVLLLSATRSARADDPIVSEAQSGTTQQVSAAEAEDGNPSGAGDSGSDGGTVTIEGMVVDGGGDGSSVVQDIPGLTETEFVSDGKNNAIQEAIDAALRQISEDTKATVIISITSGSYSGDISIAGDDSVKQLAEKLVLVSADAFSVDESSGYAVYAENPGGGVKLGGDIEIESLDVLLYGLYLSAQKKIKLTDAQLRVVGTTEADTVSVDVFGGEDERFGLEIDTLGGNDTVKVTQTGDRYAVNAEPMVISVDGGAGSDTIDVTLGGKQTLDVSLDGGAGNDSIALRVVSENAESSKTVRITDMAGDNTVTAVLKKNRTALSIATGDGKDTVTVSAEKDAKNGTLSIATGGGNDTVKLNVSVADALALDSSLLDGVGAVIGLDAGDGVDTLHLSGSLSTKAAERIAGDGQSIRLVNSSEKRLILNLNGTVEHFTDDLSNKETVKIERLSDAGYALDSAGNVIWAKAFVTYTYAASRIDLLRLPLAAQTALFCILRIDGGSGVTVNRVLCPGLTLMIAAKSVTVTGELCAAAIHLSAEANDANKIGGTTLPVLGSDSLPDELKKVSMSFFQFKGEANIHIAPTAYLHVSSAVGTVTLNTLTSYTHMLLDVSDITAGLNFANVKICSSIIDIAGRIEAYAVSALAKAVVTVVASNSLASLLFVPVAVSVGVSEAGVRVHGTPLGGNDTIRATDEVSLLADSAMTVTTTAGTGRLPITFAVSVSDNMVYSRIEENAVVRSGGAVTVGATGTATVKTTAQKGEKDASNSGGYFAVAVVSQDVNAGVYGNASVFASGKLNITALAKENVVTLATSAKPSGSGAELSLSSVLDFGKSLLTVIGTQLAGNGLDKLTKAKKQIEGSAHAISMAETKNGTAAVSAAKADENNPITITVSPDKGYALDKIVISYYKAGEKTETLLTPTKVSEATYTFVMPKADVRIAVTFKTGSSGGGDNGGGTNGTGGNGVKDIVEKVASNNSTANRAVTSEPATNAKAKTVTVTDAEHGAVLVDIMKLSGDSAVRVLPSKQVKVTFNPAEGYTIDTLKAVYTGADGKQHEILISENSNGDYVFTMPDAAVSVNATFKQGTAEKKGSSSTQLTGALAVSVGGNGSVALLDTTGTVTSGNATVKAAADTDVANTADATPNGTEPDPDVTGDPDDEITAGRTISDALVIAELRNGAVSAVEGPTDGKRYTFTFAPRLGYKLDGVQCTYVNCAGEKRSFTLPAFGESETAVLYELGNEYIGKDGRTWEQPKYGLAFHEQFVITATFKKVGDGNTVSWTADEGEGVAVVQIAEGSGDSLRLRDGVKAKAGDKVVFTLKGGNGYAPGTAAAVAVKYVLNGEEKTLTVANGGLSVSGDGKAFAFTMPGAVVDIHAAFTQKANKVEVTLTNGSALNVDDPMGKYLVISDSKHIAGGERFTITLTDAAILAGLRIDTATAVAKLKFTGDEVSLTPEYHLRDTLILARVGVDGRESEPFTLQVSLALVNGSCAVTYQKDAGDETGNTVTIPKYADPGDTIKLVPVAADNYKLTDGSLHVTVETSAKTITGAASKGKNGAYAFTIPKEDGVTVQTITVGAKFEQAPGSKQAKSVSVGVGVAVAVISHSADAAVKNGKLSVNGLSIQAASTANASSVAKAGYSEGNIGVAGAIAVNIASAKTSAMLHASPVVTLGGGALEIKASSEGKLNTNADSSGAKMKKGTGVGAAIAVGVFTTNVRALIEENAQLLQGEKPLSELTVKATQSLTQSIQTKAGASGGTAITPVLTLLLCETDVEATVASASAARMLKVEGDATVASENTVKRTLAANASAAGANVGVGASFIVSYLKDRSRAQLYRSLNTNKNVNVTAKGLITLKSTARAGANGSKSRKTASEDSASEDGGEADKQAKDGVGAVKGLQGKSNNTSETGKQKAETSEGSISVAAAFILNLQTNTVSSAIAGGAVILAAGGKVTVGSTAQTDSRLKASGSATVAKIGVGVAVALNVVHYSNIALIGDACILAKNLSVTALLPEAKAKKDEAEEADPNNYILVFVKGLVKKFLNLIAEDGFLRGMKSAITSDDAVNTITRILLGEDNANLKALLSGTGLEKILDANPVDTFLKNWDACFAEIRAMLKHEDYEALKELVVDEVKAEIVPLLTKYALTLIGALQDGFGEGGFGGALKSVCGLIVNKAKTFFADSKDPAYWADQMSNLFISASKELLSGVADLEQTKKFITDNFKGKLVENLKSYLSHLGMALTNEALNRLSALGNLTIKAQDPVPAHVFHTYAIAGAGAFDVGVAGSAAVAWITGSTLAYLAPVSEQNAAAYPITVTGDTLVRAESVHRMETVATSAVGSNDEPDTNDSEAGDGDDTGKAAGYETKNVALKDGDKTRVLYLTTANADISGKTDDDAGGYTVVYKAKDGYRFTDKSVELTDIAEGKVTKVLSDDHLTLTVKVAYKGADLKDSFTLKVTGAACEERTITPPQNVKVSDVDVNIVLNKEKAKKCDRVTVTISPKEPDQYEVNEDNIKKAVTDGKLKLAWTGADGAAHEIKTYEVDKKGNLIFFFLMPDENVTLAMTMPTATDKLPLFTAVDPKKQAKTEEGHGVGIGAAFSMAYTQFDTEAYIGANRKVTTGTFWLDAEGGLEVRTVAVSGTDPIGSGNKYYGKSEVAEDSVKKIAVDAGVAFAYLGGSVRAFVEAGSSITTTGDSTVNINKTKLSKTATDEQKNLSEKAASFAVTAREWSVTEARASAFTAGSTTAVGACVAVNYIDVSVLASFAGTADVKGAAYVTATSSGKDVARGVATAMGADMDRYAKKFRSGTDSLQESANKVTNGEAFNGNSGSSKTETGKKISTKFEKGQSADGKKSNGNTPVSSQAARSQNAGGDAGEAIQKGNEAAEKAKTANQNGDAKASYQVAAAVSLNITAHAVKVEILGNIRFGELTVQAVNDGNFSTLATGAAMSLSKSSNAVAAAVAVSLNKNTAIVRVADRVTLTYNQNSKSTGEVRIESRTSQNITDEFSRYMTAQSLAGAISGDGGKVTIAGAVSVVKAQAETSTLIGSGVTMTAGDVTIGAFDKSRLTARAGSVSFSKGTARGLGASFALIYAEDGILTRIGDGVRITSKACTIYAEKASVNTSDYSALDWRFLFTNSSDLTDEQRARTQRGIVDVHKNSETGGYSVDLNFSTDTVLELIELCNYFSAVNYYVEAISGAITSGSNTKLVASGSFGLLFVKNSVQALVGDGVEINAAGDAKLSAKDDSRVRVIAGSVAAGPAKDAGGLTVGFIKDSGTVRAKLGNGAGTTAVTASTYTMTASNSADYLVITVAVAAAKQDAVGGAVTVAVLQNRAEALVTDGVTVHTVGGADKAVETALRIASEMNVRLMLISASASLADKVAAGGTIAAVYNEAAAQTDVGARAVLTADQKKLSITASTAEWMLNILASASAAKGSGEGTGFAGAIGLLWDKSHTGVTVGSYAQLTAAGDVAIRTAVDSTLLNIFAGAAYGGGNAIGMTFLFNYLERVARNSISDHVLISSQLGNISVDALGTEWTLIVGVAVGASSNTSALAGTNGATLSGSTAETLLGNDSTLSAGDSISLTSNLLIRSYQIVTGLAFTGGKVGVGETITVMTIENTVRTIVGENVALTAGCLGGGLTTGNRKQNRRGIYIGATASESLLAISVSGSAGGKLALSGVAHVLCEKNRVEAKVGAGAALSAVNRCIVEPVDKDGNTITADVKVEADDDSSIIDIAGGLAAGSGMGFGATALALLFSKSVTADASLARRIEASGNVAITAAAKDTLALLALNFGFAKNVALAGSANALLYENQTTAALGGAAVAGKDITVSACSRETLINLVVSVAVSGTVGIAAVAVLTFFNSVTKANVSANAALTAGGNISITSNSIEYLSADVLGGAGGKFGVGGALNLIRSKLLTSATTGTGARITAAGDVAVRAFDDYKLLSVSGMIGVGGTVGVGVVVTLSFHYNSVGAGVGKDNAVSGRNVSVLADSKRDFQTFTMTVAAAGTAAVGAAVALLIAGGNLVQDACDTVLGTETVGGKSYSLYYAGDKAVLYRSGDKYYTRGANDAMTEATVATVAGESGVTYNGKNYMPSAMNPQAQIEGVAEKCNVTLTGGSDINSTIVGDGNTSDKMGGAEYDRYANADTKDRVDKGNEEPITSAQIDGTKVDLDKEHSKNGDLLDGTKAHIDGGSTVTASENITVQSHDLLLAIVLAGSVAVAGTAGVGVGFAAAKLMSSVHATVAETATLRAENGDITVRAICGAENKAITDEFCPVTNTMGCQKTANDNMPGVRGQLEKAGLIAKSDVTGSLWLLSIAAAGGGMVGVGVAGGVLLFYSDVEAKLSGTVEKARNLLVDAELNYRDVLTVVISLGLAGTVGVGVSVAVAYLEGSVTAEISDGAQIRNVSGRIGVKALGESKLRTGAAALAIGGIVGVSANISVLINKNTMRAGVSSGAVIDAPDADLAVDANFKAETCALLIAVAGGMVGVAVSVLLCIAEMKVHAYVGLRPDETGPARGGSVNAYGVSATAKANGPVQTLIVSIAAGLVGVGAVVSLSINRIENVATVTRTPVTVSHGINVEALLSGETKAIAVTAAVALVTAKLVIAVALIRTKNIARFDGGDTTAQAESLSVHAKTESSFVRTEIAAGALGLANFSVYVALALNLAENRALVGSTGRIVLSGALTLLSEGVASAEASALTYAEIGLINISSTVSIAHIAATYGASVTLDGGYVKAGAVQVRSLFASLGDGAKAVTGNAGNSPSISVFEMKFLGTFASSTVQNAASVSGSGSLLARSLVVEANTDSKAGAYTRQIGVGVIRVVIIAASARECDDTAAYVSGTDETHTLTVTLDQSAALLASGKATVEAESITPLSVALVSIGVGSVLAQIGRSAQDRHTVAACIGTDVLLTAAQVSVTATSSTFAKSRMRKGYSIGAVTVDYSTVPTKQYTDVRAGVGARSRVEAKTGSIAVSATGTVKADSLVNGESVGVIVSADVKYAKNTVDQSVAASVGAQASLNAHNGISVTSVANATLLADTNSDSAGLVSAGMLQAHNDLTRLVNVTLGDGATLFADFGDILIRAAGGELDDIQTFARGGGYGLVGIGKIESNTKVSASATVNVGRGVTITDTFHSVLIQAHVYEHKAVSTGDYSVTGLVAAPEIRSFVATMNLTAHVTFVKTQDGFAPTRITAREITVEAKMPSLHVSALSNAESYMLGGTTRAYSTINVSIDVQLSVSAAILRAYDRLFLFASANPDSYGTNLYSRAQGYSGAVISYTVAEAKLSGTSKTRITVDDDTELTGADVRVETEKFAGSVSLNAIAKKAALGWRREKTIHELTHDNGTTVQDRTIFHVADAAAGICIDYYYDADGMICERTVGMVNEGQGRTFATITGTTRISLANVRIENLRPGELSVEGVNILACKVYGQAYLQRIVITNHTDAELLIGVIDTYNEAFTRSSVIAAQFTQAYQHESPTDTPSILIESAGKGNVWFMGKVVNDRGSLTVRWTGEERGSLYTNQTLYLNSTRIAPIWSHQLTVVNAVNVGESEAKPFEAYLTAMKHADGSYENPAFAMSGVHTAYAKLSLSEIIAFNGDTLPDGMDQSEIPGRLDLSRVSAQNLTILCGTPFRMYYLAKAEAAVIVLPGVVEFTTETVAFDPGADLGAMMFSMDQIARYYIGQSSVKTQSSDSIKLNLYYLPNELVIYLVEGDSGLAYGYKPNELYKVTGSYINFDTSKYRLLLDTSGTMTVVLRNNGDAELNLSTGVITAGSTDISLYVNYDEATKTWLIPQGDLVVPTTLNEIYVVQYTVDENKSRVPVLDANNNPVLVLSRSLGPEVFKLNGLSYYLLYDNTPSVKTDSKEDNYVYYIAFTAEMDFSGVYRARVEDAWASSQRDVHADYFGTSAVIEWGDFQGISGLTLRAEFEREGALRELYLAKHRLIYHGVELSVHCLDNIYIYGQDWYFIDYVDEAFEGAFNRYWRYMFDGGSEPFSYATAHTELNWLKPITDSSKLQAVNPELVTEESTDEDGNKHVVKYNAYRYGNLTNPQTRLHYAMLLSYDTVYYVPDETVDVKLPMAFLTDVVFGKAGEGITYHYDGAYVTLYRGMSMRLSLLPATEERGACYRIFENLWITENGEVVGKRAAGLSGVEIRYEIYTYSMQDGTLSIEQQIGNHAAGKETLFLLQSAGGSQSMLIRGNVHLERTCANVARDILGRFYYLDAGQWTGLDRIDGDELYKHGYFMTADGAEVYWRNKRMFTIGKNADDKVLHTIYKVEDDSIRYSVDEDGVVTWGYEINPAAYQGFYGGSEQGSYLVKASESTGEVKAARIVVEAGAALKIDAKTDLKQGQAGDVILGDVELMGPDNEHSPWPDGHPIPAGKLVMDAAGNIAIGELDAAGGDLTLSAGGDLGIEHLLGDGSKVELTAGGDLVLPDADLSDGSGVSLTAGNDVRIDCAEITPTGELTIDAGGNIEMKEATLGGTQATLTAGEDILAEQLTLEAADGFTAEAENGDIEIQQSDTQACGPLTLKGTDILLHDNLGDLKLAGVTAENDVLLVTDGNVTDVSGNATTGLMTNLRRAQSEEDAALRVLFPLQQALEDAIRFENAAQQELFAAQDALNRTNPQNTRAWAAAEARLERAQEALRLAQEDTDELETAVNGAKTVAQQKQAAVAAARAALDQDIGNDDATLKAGGDVTVQASGSIGSEDAPLLADVEAGGVTLNAGGDVELYSESTLHLAAIESDGDVAITSADGIQRAAGSNAPLEAPALALTALGGDIGSEERPILLSEQTAITASGEDVFLRSRGDLVAGDLTAHGDPADGELPNGYLWLWADDYYEPLPGAELVYGRLFLHAKRRNPAMSHWRLLIDIPTGVMVGGYLTVDAALFAEPAPAGAGWPSLSTAASDCPACAALLGALGLSGRIGGHAIRVSGDHEGKLRVSLPVGDAARDGDTVLVLCCAAGRLALYTCTVEEGYANFTVDAQRINCLLFTDAEALYAYLDGIELGCVRRQGHK